MMLLWVLLPVLLHLHVITATTTTAIPKTTTLTETTAASSTTLPSTTTTTTLSPQEKHRLWCTYNFLDWSPKNTECIRNEKIIKECYKSQMNISNEYLRCKSILKYEISKPIARHNSMFFHSYLKFFGSEVLRQFFVERSKDEYLKARQTQRKIKLVYSNMIWITGFQFRYSDISWLDYSSFKRGKWNRRNDTIKVPYGALPRGEYSYEFALYDSMWTSKLNRELVRLKESWPDQHIILDGEHVSYDTERGLYFKSSHVVNSAVLQLYVQSRSTPPTPTPNPLPTRLTIVLNHLDRNMEKPICVYWQQVDDYYEELVTPKGYWSNYGMEVQFTNRTMTICRASHYGTFALLMEPIHAAVAKPMSTVDILTIIFSLIALLLLVGFIISMGMLECYRSMQCRIYIAIAVSLFFADLFYFAGIFARRSSTTCTNLMTLSELTFMCVVTWFMIDAIHQLNMIKPLFNPKTNANAFYTIIGIGLPLAVLIAMLEFPYPPFDELAYCWPNINGAHYLYFIGPLSVVILVAGFLRMLTFEKIRSADKRQLEDVNFIRAYYGTQAAVVVLVTCLVFWIVASAGVHSERKTGDVIQVVLAAIQIVMSGQIIFYFFHKNDEVVDALETQKQILERMRLNRMDHLAGVIMDVKYVPNAGDVKENQSIESEVAIKDSKDRVNKFDSMFGLNTYAQSGSPDHRDDFTSQSSLIR